MKLRFKIILGFVVLLLFILAGVILYTHNISVGALPDYDETLHIPGLRNEVKVYRDQRGVPHIYAENEHDLYRVTGYIMAQERLWQMDLLRRVTLGRISEIFGEDYIETDVLLRSLQYTAKSERILEDGDSLSIAAVKEFTEGVNFYIQESDGHYPIEFTLLGYEPEPWQPVHSINLIGYMAWDLKSGWSELILNELAQVLDSARLAGLLPQDEIAGTTVFPTCDKAKELLAHSRLQELSKLESLGLDIFNGSNNWAVAGSRTRSGKPLLANDMHLALGIPGVWLQVHQVVKDQLNVTGLALPGQPFIIVGHNDSIAWGMTNTYVDNLDYYEEVINPDDSNQYLFNGEWRTFDVYHEKIGIRGGEEVERMYRRNHRGPDVSAFKHSSSRTLTIRWIGDLPSDELRSIYLVNRASGWPEFCAAFESFRTISQNVVFADVRGNIGLYCCGGVPVRKRSGIFEILPGDSDEYDWQGLIPFEELPHSYNPECGYVSSANNKTVDSLYPYHIGTWYAQPYRIDRIREVLSRSRNIDREDLMDLQNDTRSEFARLFIGKMLPLVAADPGEDEEYARCIELLESWDFSMDADLAQPAILETWSSTLLASCLKDELGDSLFNNYLQVIQLPRIFLYNLLNGCGTEWYDNVQTPEKEDAGEIATSSLQAAIEILRKEYGSPLEEIRWGDVHRLTLRHPLSAVDALNKVFKLNRGPFAVSGSYHTVAPYTYMWSRPDSVFHGASHRNIYDLSAWDSSASVIPTGTSGIPASDHYCDQTAHYLAGKYYEDPFSEEIVLDASVSMAVYLP